MKTLIDNILSLENQANEILESHRTQAKTLDKEAEAKVATIQSEIAAQVEARVAGFRVEAEKKYEQELAAGEAAFKKTLQAIDKVGDSVVKEHARRVVARFREI